MNFKEEVLDRSFTIPVLVDFWAPWCGPCRVLTPVIEKIEEEQRGKWALVKLNTEEYPELADQYQIRSIPNVKLFYRGEVIQEFMGALPRQAILDWLKKNLPDEGLQALDQLLAENQFPSNEQMEALLNRYPERDEIRLVYAQLILWDQPQLALQILEPIRMSSLFAGKANDLRAIVNFLVADSSDPEIKSIQEMLFQSRIEEAIPAILKVLAADADPTGGLLAKASIGIFNTLGNQHPLSKQYRKQLDMYLWK